MAYEFNVTGYHDLAGNGSYIVPETWIPRWSRALSTEACWSQFVTGEIDGERLLAAGMGDTIRVNFAGNVNVPTSDLVFGSWTPNGTQSMYQTALTVYEYGNRLLFTGDEVFKVANGIDSFAMDSIVVNALQAWEYRIGAAAIAAEYNFDCRSDTSLVYSAAAGGTGGTAYCLPYHVRNMVATLRRNNIPGFPDAPYSYVAIGPAGMWGAIAAQTEFQRIASVQNPELYTRGVLGIYNDILFVEESGVNVTTYSTTAGTGVIMGAGLIGDTSVGKDPRSFALWWDSRDHPGRYGYVGWWGHYAVGRVPTVGTCARVCTIHAKCE